MRTLTILTILSGLFLIPCSDSLGQFGGRRGGDWNRDRDDDDDDDRRGRRGRDDDDDDRRGDDRDRGDRGRGRGGWGNFDAERFWKDRDKNKDGVINPNELEGRERNFLRSDKPVKISELVSRFEEARRGRGDRGRDGDRRDRDRDDRRSEEEEEEEEEEPLVPGFGIEEDENATVPGFGPPEDEDEETEDNEGGSDQNASSSSSGGESVSSNTYVNGVFERHDADKNDIIEGDELRNAKGLPPKADGNGDGKLTREELAAVSVQSSSTSNSSSSSNRTRKSYRFASAHERLNGSAKSWIISRDKNGDGQVAMHEFSRTWNDSKVREFQRYDRNGDGIVTAEEYESR